MVWGAEHELAVTPPTPRPPLPRWSLEHQAGKARGGVIVRVRRPRGCTVTRPRPLPQVQSTPILPRWPAPHPCLEPYVGFLI